MVVDHLLVGVALGRILHVELRVSHVERGAAHVRGEMPKPDLSCTQQRRLVVLRNGRQLDLRCVCPEPVLANLNKRINFAL